MHPAESESPVLATIREGSTSATKSMRISYNTLSEGIYEAEPVNVYPAAAIFSGLDDDAEKSVFDCYLSREIYQTVEIVANIDQTT